MNIFNRVLYPLFLFLILTVSLEASLRNRRAPPVNQTASTLHQPFVIFSPPKCGTHLFGKALGLITDKKASYYLSDIGNSILDSLTIIDSECSKGNFVAAHHFTNTLLKMLVQKGYKIIFIVRDPRDQLISVANWLQEGQWPWLPVSKITDRSAQITELITGSALGWQSVESCFLCFENELSGLPKQSVYLAQFEKLIGSPGLGSDNEQVEEIVALANFLEMPLSEDKIDGVVSHLYGGTKTFREGTVNKWKQLFTSEQKEAFRIRYNDLLFRLGYESNPHW